MKDILSNGLAKYYLQDKNGIIVSELFDSNKNIINLPAGAFCFLASDIMNQMANLKHKSGVYMLYNPESGKYYVGSSANLWNRLLDYGQNWFVKINAHLPISKAIVKYNYNTFIIIVLEYVPENELISTEQKYIDMYKPLYNVLKTAGSTHGHKHSEETKAKMRASKQGKVIWTEESRKKLSESLMGVTKGYKRSAETKAKISEVARNRDYNNNPPYLIEVLDTKKNITTTYVGYANACLGLKMSHTTIKKYNGRQYKDYFITIHPPKK